MNLFQELAEIVLNINEAESNEDITAQQAKEAHRALLEDAGLQLEIITEQDLLNGRNDVGKAE